MTMSKSPSLMIWMLWCTASAKKPFCCTRTSGDAANTNAKSAGTSGYTAAVVSEPSFAKSVTS